MHITVSRKDLASAFTWAYGALPKRAIAPVLSGMRLAVEGRALTLSAFDYEQSRRARLGGQGPEAGQVLVNGPELKKIISTLPKGDRVTVDISADHSALTLASQGITWTLPALPDGEYPALPELPPLVGAAGGEEFARAVGRVFPAAGRDDTLPVLTCIQFQTHSAALVLTATDRYRVLPGAEDADVGGIRDADVVTRKGPAAGGDCGALVVMVLVAVGEVPVRCR